MGQASSARLRAKLLMVHRVSARLGQLQPHLLISKTEALSQMTYLI
jgi:hypothetical protein